MAGFSARIWDKIDSKNDARGKKRKIRQSYKDRELSGSSRGSAIRPVFHASFSRHARHPAPDRSPWTPERSDPTFHGTRGSLYSFFHICDSNHKRYITLCTSTAVCTIMPGKGTALLRDHQPRNPGGGTRLPTGQCQTGENVQIRSQFPHLLQG